MQSILNIRTVYTKFRMPTVNHFAQLILHAFYE